MKKIKKLKIWCEAFFKSAGDKLKEIEKSKELIQYSYINMKKREKMKYFILIELTKSFK